MTETLDLADLTDEVAKSLGLGRPVRPMHVAARGEQARVWRLDCDSGAFAVKQALPGFEPRSDGLDVRFQEAVAEQTSVLVPAPVRDPGGRVLVTVAGQVLRAAAWVDLVPPDRSLDAAAVGALLADLHRVRVPGEPIQYPASDVDAWYAAPVGADQWHDLADRLRLAAAPFASALSATIPALLDLEAAMEAPATARLCHCDLWANNLCSTVGGELCVIDWDNCGPADPVHELGMLLVEFGREEARCRSLVDAYVARGGVGVVERVGQLTMVIAQFGHFWQMAAEEWLRPDADATDRAHAVARVEELLDDPFTLDTAETVVRWAGR